MKKILRLIESVVLAIVFGIVTMFLYNKLVEVHTASCCTGLTECPLYACVSTSPDLLKFTLFAAGVVLCAILTIAFVVAFFKDLLTR